MPYYHRRRSGIYEPRILKKLFETYRKENLHARLLMVERRLQREGDVVHVIVRQRFDLLKMLGKLVQREQDHLPVLTLSRADEKSSQYPAQNKRTQVRESIPKEAFHNGMNFK